jgi:phytoene synthase
MDATQDAAPLASFIAKWTGAYPELRLALGFVPGPLRGARAAFACLGHELEHASFGTRDDQPAAVKLAWWAEELTRAGAGEARHPLTIELAKLPAWNRIAASRWHEVIAAALELRDPGPAADGERLLAAWAPFHRPQAAIEAELFGTLDVEARARQRAIARSMEDLALLGNAIDDGRLPLPLDVLARHQLARNDLGRDSPARRGAVHDWLAQLDGVATDLARSGAALGVLGVAALSAGGWRARRALRSSEPVATLHHLHARLPLTAAWATWRAARRA